MAHHRPASTAAPTGLDLLFAFLGRRTAATVRLPSAAFRPTGKRGKTNPRPGKRAKERTQVAVDCFRRGRNVRLPDHDQIRSPVPCSPYRCHRARAVEPPANISRACLIGWAGCRQMHRRAAARRNMMNGWPSGPRKRRGRRPSSSSPSRRGSPLLVRTRLLEPRLDRLPER